MIPLSAQAHPIYTVTLAQIRNDDSLKHDLIVTTSDREEALRIRDELNHKKTFLGSKSIAQLIRREDRPRQWKLLAHVSSGSVHLRCALSQARGILRNPTREIIESLKCGHMLSSHHPVNLQSERVQVHIEGASLRNLTYARMGGASVTRKVVVREPVISYLDISSMAELIHDNHSGVIARHPIEEDRLTLPERFAKALWTEGIVLPIKLQKKSKVMVRLTDPELRSRLAIFRLNSRSTPVAPPRSIPHVALPAQDLSSQSFWSGVLQPI